MPNEVHGQVDAPNSKRMNLFSLRTMLVNTAASIISGNVSATDFKDTEPLLKSMIQ